jgi:TetR/AcrR family transcriptional repressor of uid operon
MVKQARAQVTRETIVQSAGAVFARTVYSSAPLSEIIAEAGVTQGSLYFHFDSKQALALEVVKQQHEKSITLGSGFISSTAPGIDAMVMLSSALAHQMTTDVIVRGGLRLTTEFPELFPEYVQEPYSDWISTCELLLRRASEEGDLSDRHDIPALAAVIISSFTGIQVVSQAATQWADLHDRLEAMWIVLLPAIVSERRMADITRLASLSQPTAVSK